MRSRRSLSQTLDSLAAQWPEDTWPAIQEALAEHRQKVVVLDDDPTGTQTVHGIPVLTHWSVAALQEELENDLPAFYILTNSRSLLLPEAQALNREIGENLVAAADASGERFVVVSRSDSTLRGHFPGEVEALAEALDKDFDAWLIIPFFLEGGRYTIDDTHYVVERDDLVPAGETAYADDATFGYKQSNLKEWVEEKTGGATKAEDVASISLQDIRAGGPEQVEEKLRALPRGAVCIVNAATMADIGVFVQGLLAAEAAGRSYLYRTAASFVPVRAGIRSRPLLTADDLRLTEGVGGLFVVGSYVPKTTTQVGKLLEEPGVTSVEITVRELLEADTREAEVKRVAQAVNEALQAEKDVLIFTSRELITGDSPEESRQIGQQIASGVIEVVRAISVRPRYLLAKGGITSSDVATEGLGVERAMVRGQILPGVPLWELGEESRYPGLPYLVFPGNVGGAEALIEIREQLAP